MNRKWIIKNYQSDHFKGLNKTSRKEKFSNWNFKMDFNIY